MKQIKIGLLLCVMFISCQQTDVYVYVDLNKVYEEFEYRKVLSSELQNKIDKDQKGLDSLEFTLKALNRQLNIKRSTSLESQFEKLAIYYKSKSQDIEETNQAITLEYDEKLWKQLNQYIKDYGESSDLNFVLGANGSGSVLYAKDELNRTAEVIDYVNKKYNGEL